MPGPGSDTRDDFTSRWDGSPGGNHIAREKDESIGCLRGRPLQVTCALAANIISLEFGACVGWPSAVGSELGEVFSPDEISWIITVTVVGALTGALCWGQVTPRLGPKKANLVVGIPMLIAWCLLLKASTLWCAISGRILGGFAMGGIAAVLPQYVSEISEDALRGILGSIMVLTFNIGTLVVYALGAFTNSFYIALIFASGPIVFMILFSPCPESPIYLLSNGREEAGRQTLKKLRYPKDINDELASINRAGTSTDGQNAGFVDILRERASRKALGISLILFTIQQICGIIPVLSYASDIFQRAGGSLTPIASSCVIATVQILGSILGILLIERAGRRCMMIFSSFVMALSHGLLGYALMPDSTAPRWLPLVALSAFMISYAAGVGGMPYVIMTELCSPSIRAKVASITLCYNGLFSLMVTKTYIDMIRLIGANGVFWLYATGCAAGGVCLFFVLPETAGKSNASIQDKLDGGRNRRPVA